MIERDHLFISYAWEDGDIAEWLALRLTAEGYRVWIDRFELLGGEPYPKDIDDAIKTRTFRMLALLSRHSLAKENPRKERTLALNLQRERKEELLIPLNVDGRKPTELDWMLSDLTFIPFDQSWAKGLDQLLRKLDRAETPKASPDEGKEIAASAYLPPNVVAAADETVHTNLLRIRSLPETVRGFRLSRPLERAEKKILSAAWPHFTATEDLALSFWKPWDLPPGVEARPAGVHLWKKVRDIAGIRSEYVVKPLVRKAILWHVRSRGLEPTHRDDVLYFPPGLLKDDRLRFISYTGKKTRLQAVGERNFRSETYRYHLAVTFDVRRDLMADMVVAIRLKVHLTDLEGVQLEHASALARRKQLTRNWWNHQWLSRHLAVCRFLARGEDHISILPEEETEPVVLDHRPLRYQAPLALAEEDVPKGQAPYSKKRREGSRDE